MLGITLWHSGSVVIPVGASSIAVFVNPSRLDVLRTGVLTVSASSDYNVGSPNSATVTVVVSI